MTASARTCPKTKKDCFYLRCTEKVCLRRNPEAHKITWQSAGVPNPSARKGNKK